MVQCLVIKISGKLVGEALVDLAVEMVQFMQPNDGMNGGFPLGRVQPSASLFARIETERADDPEQEVVGLPRRFTTHQTCERIGGNGRRRESSEPAQVAGTVMIVHMNEIAQWAQRM